MQILTTVDRPELTRALAADQFLWVDLTAPDEVSVEALGSVLMLHPLALADTRDFGQRPKSDRYEGGALIVAYGADPTDELAAPMEVHLLVAPEYLVTVHEEADPGLHALRTSVPDSTLTVEAALVVRVLDALVRSCEQVVEMQATALDALEDAVLERARGEQLEQLVRLRHAIAGLHRRIGAEQDVFADIEQVVLELPGLDPDARPYLRNIGDRLARAEGRLAALQATAGSLADLYFNANANRLTEISERLSVIATILLPLTLVTGFFGQNFGWLVRHIDSLTAFLLFGVGGLVLPSVLAVAYLRRRSGQAR